MLRKIFLISVSVFIFTAAVWSQTSTDKHFKDNTFPLTLFYSPEWEAVTPSNSFTLLKLVNKDLLGLVDFRLDAISRPEAKGWSPGKFVKAMMDDPSIAKGLVNTAYPGAKVLDSGKTFISQQEAFFLKSAITYRDLDGEMNLLQYQATLLYEETAYTLTFRAPTEIYDICFPDFKVIASSIVILPKVVVRAKTPIKIKKSTKSGKKNK